MNASLATNNPRRKTFNITIIDLSNGTKTL